MLKRASVTFSIVLTLFFAHASKVRGLQLEVTGNGDGSANEIAIQQEQTTTSQQQNTSEITNTVETASNTGNNQANDNTADETNITTGDSITTVAITNTSNTSYINNDCCLSQDDLQSSLTISGNGTGSINTAEYEHTTNYTVVIDNTAIISNTIQGYVNTGGNVANNNNGDSTIITGNIVANDSIFNVHINSAHATIGNPQETIVINISGNGSDSINSANLLLNSNNALFINNYAKINNDSSWFLNTGNNEINNGNGDAFIKTGGIAFASLIENKDINSSDIEISCCEKSVDDPSDPATPTTPPTPPAIGGNTNNGGNNGGTGGDGGNSGGNGTGASVGSVLASQLPATGLGWWLYATIANIIMLLMGLYLRLHAGRSPCYAKK